MPISLLVLLAGSSAAAEFLAMTIPLLIAGLLPG